MLRTNHKAVFVETGKVDSDGNKIEKPETFYYYWGHVGNIDLSDQLLKYFLFLQNGNKWVRKLLIHLLNFVIVNAYILHWYKSLEKLSQEE